MSKYDDQYDEIIQLFLEFRKMHAEDKDWGDSLALGFLQNVIKQKVREYTRGAVEFVDLKEGQKFIILPLNGFDCCRRDGMNRADETYPLMEKCIENGKPRARNVMTKISSIIGDSELVLRITC